MFEWWNFPSKSLTCQLTLQLSNAFIKHICKFNQYKSVKVTSMLTIIYPLKKTLHYQLFCVTPVRISNWFVSIGNLVSYKRDSQHQATRIRLWSSLWPPIQPSSDVAIENRAGNWCCLGDRELWPLSRIQNRDKSCLLHNCLAYRVLAVAGKQCQSDGLIGKIFCTYWSNWITRHM